MTEFTVGTTDFRAGLRAVLKHAHPIADHPFLSRVRLHVGRENLTLTATDRFSSGLAIVSIIAPDNPDSEIIDLSLDDCRSILSEFKGGREKNDEPEYLLSFATTREFIAVTDTSGMVDGKTLQVPRIASSDQFPDLALALSRMRIGHVVQFEDLVVDGERLALFKEASAVYRQPLVISSNSNAPPLLIRCAESFPGSCSPHRPDEEKQAEIDRWNQSWTYRLPDPTSEPMKPEADGETNA